MNIHFYTSFQNLYQLANEGGILVRTKKGATVEDNIHISVDVKEYGIREIPGSPEAFIVYALYPS